MSRIKCMRFSVHHKTGVKFRFAAAAPGEEATLTWVTAMLSTYRITESQRRGVLNQRS
jgi:hypothetical protein